jgi:hypothetical protein
MHELSIACEALTFAFDVAVDDSPIKGARLDVEPTDGQDLELVALEVLDASTDR